MISALGMPIPRTTAGNRSWSVIDVLAKVRKPTGNKQLYEADYEALTGLTQLAGELGLAIVVVHHTRKMASDDLMETVSGSFGISGAVDTILVLANKASGTVLDVRGRDVESREFAIEFSKNVAVGAFSGWLQRFTCRISEAGSWLRSKMLMKD